MAFLLQSQTETLLMHSLQYVQHTPTTPLIYGEFKTSNNHAHLKSKQAYTIPQIFMSKQGKLYDAVNTIVYTAQVPPPYPLCMHASALPDPLNSMSFRAYLQGSWD